MRSARTSAETRFEHDEATVRGGFWTKLGGLAAQIPFAEDLLTAYYCAFDRQTPRHVQVALLGAIAGLESEGAPRARREMATVTGGCPFAPRCVHAQPVCTTMEPPEETVPGGGRVRCHFPL